MLFEQRKDNTMNALMEIQHNRRKFYLLFSRYLSHVKSEFQRPYPQKVYRLPSLCQGAFPRACHKGNVDCCCCFWGVGGNVHHDDDDSTDSAYHHKFLCRIPSLPIVRENDHTVPAFLPLTGRASSRIPSFLLILSLRHLSHYSRICL